MKKLHSKISRDKEEPWFEELKKKKESEEAEYNEPVEKYTWKGSKTGTRPSGKPVRYLSGKKLRETPESEFKRINKRHTKHKRK